MSIGLPENTNQSLILQAITVNKIFHLKHY